MNYYIEWLFLARDCRSGLLSPDLLGGVYLVLVFHTAPAGREGSSGSSKRGRLNTSDVTEGVEKSVHAIQITIEGLKFSAAKAK